MGLSIADLAASLRTLERQAGDMRKTAERILASIGGGGAKAERPAANGKAMTTREAMLRAVQGGAATTTEVVRAVAHARGVDPMAARPSTDQMLRAFLKEGYLKRAGRGEYKLTAKGKAANPAGEAAEARERVVGARWKGKRNKPGAGRPPSVMRTKVVDAVTASPGVTTAAMLDRFGAKTRAEKNRITAVLMNAKRGGAIAKQGDGWVPTAKAVAA